MKISVVKEMF